MLALLEFIFSTVGLTMIVTQSRLFGPMRDLCGKIHKGLGYLMGCPMCFGLWAGILVYFLQIYNVDFILYGFMGSIFSYISYLALMPLMKKYD